MRKRTPSEIKAYGDGYAEAYKEFCHLLERHDKDKAVCKMKIFADAVALTVETATDTADTPQTKVGYCNECKWFKNKQVCGRCRSKNLFAEADTPQTERNANQCVQRVEYIGDIEKKRCRTCRHFDSEFHTPISSDGTYYPYVICTAKECHYESVDTPQTDLLVKTPRKSRESHEIEQTESTGSPIGDYRDGVGAWQTDCPWK